MTGGLSTCLRLLWYVEDFLPRRILCQPYGLSNSIVFVSAVRLVCIYLLPSCLLFFSDLNNFIVA